MLEFIITDLLHSVLASSIEDMIYDGVSDLKKRMRSSGG